ncbi:adhesion G-protein coupled receptor G5-like [Myxocyprinus asiaticus]|uniref:adhesion G-protein coupled receptor G5-like n=1 Tax=Myxocyprinus asiaticus TaxID=70543 RepID=UPI0022228574|nr:adhesion G-protein coupled receptor G5-like [Myxocyprinus asiaticus]XP_051578024.1 adhesion G-protein coupled receptor G5-like [Myxocyprinus asiaticus]
MLFSQWNITGSQIILLTVGNKSISGLKNTVNISMALSDVGDREPSCQYLDFNTSESDLLQAFIPDGCTTYYRKNEGRVVCSCDHLSYFAVLMVPSPNTSTTDMVILTYISLIGCSISLVFLVVAVVLYFTKRRAFSDKSQEVHISLALALILLNVHFLLNDLVARLSSYESCVCIAILLHYSILATFTWTAIEGVHLYLLLVRVFNIYIKRYLLKLSLVGWGFPAVVIALILSIDRKAYDRVTLTSTDVNASSIHMCYISNEKIKIVTTISFFGLVFLFNITMWLTALWRILSMGSNHQAYTQKHRAKKDICTMLGITCLLGINWGLVFFSLGSVSIAGIYLFCLFNSLHGFFIFLWFCISKCQTRDDTTQLTTNSTISTTQTSSK